jgi:hypothetical protein
MSNIEYQKLYTVKILARLNYEKIKYLKKYKNKTFNVFSGIG